MSLLSLVSLEVPTVDAFGRGRLARCMGTARRCRKRPSIDSAFRVRRPSFGPPGRRNVSRSRSRSSRRLTLRHQHWGGIVTAARPHS